MKFDHKELFLYDTYSRIEGVIGPDRATQVYGELSEHIDGLQQDFEERGLQPDLAKHAALKAMGTPREIAIEFARHSVGRPWHTAIVWVALLIIAVIFTPLDTASQISVLPGVAVLTIILMFQSVKYGTMLPKKLLVGGAIFSVLALSFIESRSVHIWSSRMPYGMGHRTLLNMRAENQKLLAKESEFASNLTQIRSKLANAATQSNLPVTIDFLSYSYNMQFMPVIIWQNRPGGFSMMPTPARKEYPVELATAAITEKLASMWHQQNQRRSQLAVVEAQINSPALYRMLTALPFTLITTTVIFGTAALLTYGAGQFSVARRTRRRQIWS